MTHINTQTVSAPVKSSLDESIVVVPRQKLFPQTTVAGLYTGDLGDFEQSIKQHHEFMIRAAAETDPSFKQIIPYMVFKHQDRYFIMQRKSTASESRLKNKYSLGIGGHIRKEDVTSPDIAAWGLREFQEEIAYNGSFSCELVGIVNDESNAVGQVHTGVLFILHGDSSDIRIRSELKSGVLWTLDECKAVYDSMETWSQLVFDFLISRSC